MFPASITSLITFLMRSSNSPRYFEPATIPARSSVTTRLFLTVSGTSPLTILSASPSAIAVFPTPGSPIRQGLFFVRLDRICTTRIISVSLPITGSSFPSFARYVRSLLYWFNVCVVPSFFLLFLFLLRSSLCWLMSSPIAISVSIYNF